MTKISPFSQSFAHLVWLLVHKQDAQAEQKEALRQCLAKLSENMQALILSDLSFTVAGAFQDAQLGEHVTWLSELSIRMSAHSARAVEFAKAAPAQEVLGVARALATKPEPDDGEAFDQMIVALSPSAIVVQVGKQGFVRHATPAFGRPAFGPARTPRSTRAVPEISTAASFDDHLMGADLSLGVHREAEPMEESENITDDTKTMMQSALTNAVDPGQGLKALLGHLDQLNGSGDATRVIDQIAREAEDRARNGLWVDLAEVLDRLHDRYEKLPDGDLRRAHLMAIRRLEKPMYMQGIVRLIPRRRELRDALTRVFAHAGETGADALIDALVSSNNTGERSAYRTVLAHCPSAIPALVHLLGDTRWYVVRNAAELLGDLGSAEADAKIAAILTHGDPRVRRSAAAALGKLATQKSVLALLQAIHDPSPDVRLQVAISLGAARNPRAVPWLLEALDKEQEKEVQAAMVSALGRMPTDEAIARLTRMSEPGGLLLRKPSAQRVQAVEALGEAGTASAKSVLRGLLADRDRAVREAAERALNETELAAKES